METPPPYAAPAKKSNTKLIIILVIALISVCCILPIVAVVGMGAWAINKGGGLLTCSIAYAMMPSTMDKYVAANNGKLPDGKKWNDDLRPFYKEVSENKTDLGPLKIMSATGEWGCTEEGVKTGMTFNALLSGKKLADIKDRDTVMIYESVKTGKNLSEAYKPQPFDKSPTTMGTGTHRGWFVVTVGGDVYIVDKDGSMKKTSSTKF